jgi:hypothetical protein
MSEQYQSISLDLCKKLADAAQLIKEPATADRVAFLDSMMLLVFVPQAILASFWIIVNAAAASLGLDQKNSTSLQAAQWFRAAVTFVISGFIGLIVALTTAPASSDLYAVFLAVTFLYLVIGCLQVVAIEINWESHEQWAASLNRVNLVLVALALSGLPVDRWETLWDLAWAVVLLVFGSLLPVGRPAANIISLGLQLFSYVLLLVLGERKTEQAAFTVHLPGSGAVFWLIVVFGIIELLLACLVMTVEWQKAKLVRRKEMTTVLAHSPMILMLWVLIVLALIFYLLAG